MVIVIDPQIAGISGDMLLCALVDIGADQSKIIDGVKIAESFLPDSQIKKIDFNSITKNGTSSTSLNLELDERFHERKGIEIQACIARAANKIVLGQKAKKFAQDSIETLIDAESKIHGNSPDSVYFHEVSSIDTVIDILGSAIALDDLKFFDDEIITLPVAVGGGTISFSHGTASNPTGAILEIFKNSGLSICGGLVKSELTTPTGASLLVNLTKNCSEFYPPMQVKLIGYGAGKKNFDKFSNVLKIVEGSKSEILSRDYVKILETNVDDVTGEVLGYMTERIMNLGAKDVTITPGITKKGRPTNIISVICDSENMNRLMDLLISETGTLGVRVSTSERYLVPRKISSFQITLEGKKFTVRCKTPENQNFGHFKIESKDIEEISRILGKSFNQTEQLLRNHIINQK